MLGKLVYCMKCSTVWLRSWVCHPRSGNYPPHEADVYSTRADLAHSKMVLGYQPKTGFPEGLSHFLKWFRAVNS